MALPESRLPLAVRRLACTVFAVYLCVAGSGCAVMMAARAPEKRDLAVLTPGMSRSQVVSELGAPVQSRSTEFGERDVFAFKQGYTLPTRVARSAGHGVADLSTLFLWELAGTPLEASLQGEDVRAEVAYDQFERVRRVEYFSGAHLANGGPTLASWMRRSRTKQTAVIGEASFGQGETYCASCNTTHPIGWPHGNCAKHSIENANGRGEDAATDHLSEAAPESAVQQTGAWSR